MLRMQENEAGRGSSSLKISQAFNERELYVRIFLRVCVSCHVYVYAVCPHFKSKVVT